MAVRTADIVVIGAGIVGVATARALLRRHPGAKVHIVEKEAGPAVHQTGHNSGVVHSGVYYRPGSLKARMCAAGLRRTREFCEANGVAYDRRGKLLVATDEPELARLDDLTGRAEQNGVEVERVSETELRRLEPNISGVAALLVPETAIVDYPGMTRALLGEVRRRGGEASFGFAVTEIARAGANYLVKSHSRAVSAQKVVACAGLQSDFVARMAGFTPDVAIMPFRGEYYLLPPSRAGIVRRLIYPVPDPALPFLGIHLTPMTDGALAVGPNAVPALAREGYGRFAFEPRQALSLAFSAATCKVVARHPAAVWSEVTGSLSKGVYLARARKYCPSLTRSDLATYRSGVRAQAVSAKGELVDDFVVQKEAGLVMVLNAPSPAATSALPLAEMICDELG